jgi:hypothetical protein
MERMFVAGGQPGRGEKGILLLMMRCGVCVSLPHACSLHISQDVRVFQQRLSSGETFPMQLSLHLIITLENTEKMAVKKTERQGKKTI